MISFLSPAKKTESTEQEQGPRRRFRNSVGVECPNDRMGGGRADITPVKLIASQFTESSLTPLASIVFNS